MAIRNVLWAVGGLAFVLAGGMAHAGTLWHIGQTDNNYGEFAIAGKHGDFAKQFPHDVLYEVGKSSSEKDWPYVHPGAGDDWAGNKPHAFKIKFKVASVPKGSLTLKIKTVETHPKAPPTLEVDVNGEWSHKLKCPAGNSDGSLTDPKLGKQATLTLSFKSKLLHPGSDFITLTAVQGSWLLYDSIVLETGSAAAEPDVAGVTAASTPLFKKVNGQLKQAVKVEIANNGLEGDCEAVIAGDEESKQKVVLSQGANVVFLLTRPFDKPDTRQVLVRIDTAEKTAEFEGKPERQWKIYVAPSAHTDIGYTDLQEKIFARHNENTAAALKACSANAVFKWNCEVSEQARWFIAAHPEEAKEFKQRASEGRIGLPGLCLNMLTGLCSGEEMARALAYGQELGRECGVPVRTATLDDVPSSVGTLPMLLRQAGIHNFVEGINVDRGPVFDAMDKRMIQSPFWWEALDGSRVLTIFSRQYSQANQMGLVNDTAAMARMLPGWIANVDRPDYPGDALYVNGAYSDNCKLDAHYADVAQAWNAEWEAPKIIIATPSEFFDYVEKNFAKDIPVFRGDMGTYWEDGAASSQLETAVVRWAKPRVTAAERWCALASALNKGLQPLAYPAADVHDAWQDILFFDEHTWGASSSISQPECEQTVKQWAYKEGYSRKAAEKATQLATMCVTAFTSLMPAKSEVEAHKGVVVVNDQSWARDLLVSVKLPNNSTVHVRAGGDGHLVASQQRGDMILFAAERVPALGYRAYKIEPGVAGETKPLLKQDLTEFNWESPRFRVRIDPRTGAVLSIEDKQLHREWVDLASGYALNQFLYVPGGEDTSMIHPGAKAAPPLPQLTHTTAKLSVVENGPVRAVLHIERTGDKVPAADTYIVFGKDDKIDFVNVLHKTPVTAKEAGYFAFPFRLDTPDTTKTFVELPYGIVEADREQLAGADREWYTTNSFAGTTDGKVTALLATPQAPMLTIGNINRGMWPNKLDNNRGTIFGYVFNNYWHTNYKASQGGDMVFAFSVKLTGGGFDPMAATRFGWEEVASMIDPRAGGIADCWNVGDCQIALVDLPKKAEGSFLQLKGAVVLGDLSRQGDSLLARLYNPTAVAQEAEFSLAGLDITGGCQTDLFGNQTAALETKMPARAIKVQVPARGLTTLKLDTTVMK